MPSKTPKQRRAMRAAAAGKSTLGIPKKVGREFVAADRKKAKRKKKRRSVKDWPRPNKASGGGRKRVPQRGGITSVRG